MKCDQCDKPGRVPFTGADGKSFVLCVECGSKLQSIIAIRRRSQTTNFSKRLR